MGSSNPHERESAWKKLDELLRKHKKSWNDLLALLQDTASPPADQGGDDGHAAAVQPRAKNPGALALVDHIIRRYVTLKEHEHLATALWVLHTHVYRQFMVSPRLALLSPVRGCGKTTLLHVLKALVHRAKRTDSISPAAIYHVIDRDRPTFLLDEADNLNLSRNDILRAVLNSGHRKGGYRSLLIKGEPRDFQLFTPMAFAAIGILPLPLMHRSIVIHMERDDGTHNLARLTDKDVEDPRSDLNMIYSFVFQWAHNKKFKLEPDPDLPKQLRNRVADNWRPLISIADSFGSPWSDKARRAAVTFAHSYTDEDVGVILLGDLRTVFDLSKAEHFASERLVRELHHLDDSMWSDWRGVRDDLQPHKLSQHELSRLLRPFGIRPKSIWFDGHARSRKGYTRDQFESAWRKYCSENGTTAQHGNPVTAHLTA
jgi:hypothetical protein